MGEDLVYSLFATPLIVFGALSGLWPLASGQRRLISGTCSYYWRRRIQYTSRLVFAFFWLNYRWCIFEYLKVVILTRDWFWAQSVGEYFRNLQRGAEITEGPLDGPPIMSETMYPAYAAWENLRLSVNFGNIHQLTGPWTSLLWVGPLLDSQKHTTCNWVKKCKNWPASILDVPAPIVRASPRYQPPLAPLSEAREGTKDYKRSCKERINQIFPHHHTVFLMKM